jgi:hypothetical protein
MLKAVIVVGVLLAQSQPTAPSRGQRQSGPPRGQSKDAQTQPATDPRGTAQSPLIVQVQPTPKTDQEAAKEQRKEENEASPLEYSVCCN